MRSLQRGCSESSGLTPTLALAFDLVHNHSDSLLAHTSHVGPEFLVTLPGFFFDAVAFPDLSVVATAEWTWVIVLFALVGTDGSTLRVIAVDSLDPEKRPSNLIRDLFAAPTNRTLRRLHPGRSTPPTDEAREIEDMSV